jgi:hypothetical protein
MIGVTAGIPTEANSSWKWSGNYSVSTMSQMYSGGRTLYQNQFQALSGDVVRVTMNCDERWMLIRNQSRENSEIRLEGLPAEATYYPHIGLHGAFDQIAVRTLI